MIIRASMGDGIPHLLAVRLALLNGKGAAEYACNATHEKKVP
jgi:hypothetical protein